MPSGAHTLAGSITSEVPQRAWTLDQVGNWDFDKLDLERDGDFNGAGERNEDRTHNLPNELNGRDTDDNGAAVLRLCSRPL